MESDNADTGFAPGTNDMTADVGSGDMSSQDRQEDVSKLPWGRDARFREFNTEYKDWKTNKADYSEWKANKDKYTAALREVEQWRNGEHPTEIQWAGAIRELTMHEAENQIRSEYEQNLKKAGLWDAFKAMQEGEPVKREDRQDVTAIIQEELNRFRGEWQTQQEAARIDQDLSSQFQRAMEASPYKGVKGFQEQCLSYVKDSIVRDHQATGRYRPVAEYVANVEAMFDDGYNIAQQRRAATKATKATKTLGGAGAPAGISRQEQLKAQRAAILAEMEAARRE